MRASVLPRLGIWVAHLQSLLGDPGPITFPQTNQPHRVVVTRQVEGQRPLFTTQSSLEEGQNKGKQNRQVDIWSTPIFLQAEPATVDF